MEARFISLEYLWCRKSSPGCLHILENTISVQKSKGFVKREINESFLPIVEIFSPNGIINSIRFTNQPPFAPMYVGGEFSFSYEGLSFVDVAGGISKRIVRY
jgi:hypothetical protein